MSRRTLFVAVVLGFALGLLVNAGAARSFVASDRAKTWRVVRHVFPPHARAKAFRVVGCETGGRYNRGAYNRAGRFLGLFQIHVPTWDGRVVRWNGRTLRIRAANLHGRYPNARAALFISRGGTDWSPWPVCGRR